MRVFLVICAALILCVGAYIGYGMKSEISAMNAAYQSRASEDRAGARRALANHPRYVFDQIVIGPGQTDDTREFRARVTQDNIAQSAYGVLGTACPEDGSASGLECWRVMQLAIDGVAMQEFDTPSDRVDRSDVDFNRAASTQTPSAATAPLAGSAFTTGDAPQDVVSSPQIPAPSAASETVSEAESPATQTDSTGAQSTDIALATAPAAASHRVRPQLVNARIKPRGEIAAKLARDTRLTILESSGGWGRFRVLDGEHRDLEIWIALSVLDPA